MFLKKNLVMYERKCYGFEQCFIFFFFEFFVGLTLLANGNILHERKLKELRDV
jgi:hypothetical protein